MRYSVRVWLVVAILAGMGAGMLAAAPVWASSAPAAGDDKKEGDAAAEGDVSSTLPVEIPQLRQGRVFSDTEVQTLLDLDRQRIEMDRREQALELREKLVDLMEKRLNARVNELKTLQTELDKQLANVSGKDDKELEQLALMYGNMKPAQAAVVLDRLDNLIVMDILVRMPVKKSGKLLEALDPAKVRFISEMLAQRTPPPVVSATTP